MRHSSVVDESTIDLAPPSVRARARTGRTFRETTTVRRQISIEALVVAATLLVLEAIVFHGYFTGRSMPPWDFTNHYNTEAYAWWTDGSFFRPPDWLPYLWGGYPSTVNLQNSSFYLPVGLMNLLTPFTLAASAVLSALHVGFGALGAYVFARVFSMRPSAALVGLVTWFFAAGFYANASHLDIMRGYAWVPWVLACASPRWPWHRWWGVLLATFVFWNAVLASYPGMLIAGVYVGAAWVLTLQLTTRARPRRYLLPLAGSLALAGAATLLRFLPFYLTRGASGTTGPDGSVVTWETLSTFFYRYDAIDLTVDPTMRAFFLPAVAFASLAFLRLSAPVVRGALAVVVTAALLGIPNTPWADMAPGLDVSRFTLSDFKVFFLFALCALAMSAVDSVVSDRTAVRGSRGRGRTRASISSPWRLVTLVTVLVGAAVLGGSPPALLSTWHVPWLLLLASAVLLVWATTALSAARLRAIVALLVVTTTASGVVWATSFPTPWSVDREPYEIGAYMLPVDTLLASRPAPSTLAQRPARAPSRQPDPAHPTDVFGNSSFYDGVLRLSGYTNLRGTPPYELLHSAFDGPSTAEAALVFWRAPGIVITSTDGLLPSATASTACATTGACGLDVVEPLSYSPSGTFSYRVVVTEPTEVSLNEAYYPGWTVTSCATDGACTTLEARAGTSGQIVIEELPAGDSTLTLEYQLPGKTASWAAFWFVVLALALWARVLAVRARSADRALRPGAPLVRTPAAPHRARPGATDPSRTDGPGTTPHHESDQT